MRIVSYNILDGGIGRADPIAEVLLAQRPDVVGLVEADDPAIVGRIAWRLGFDVIAGEGHGHSTALLSRGRIVESINHALLLGDAGPRTFLEATVELEGATLTLGVVHTTAKAHDERERVREREIEAVLGTFADRRSGGAAHVLLGDFNAVSPLQKIVPERLKPSSRAAYEAQGDLPRRVVSRVLAAGYDDALAVVRPDAAVVAASFTTLHPGQRVDYIFTFGLPRERIIDAWIESDRLATYASDHYPVGVDLRL